MPFSNLSCCVCKNNRITTDGITALIQAPAIKKGIANIGNETSHIRHECDYLNQTCRNTVFFIES